MCEYSDNRGWDVNIRRKRTNRQGKSNRRRTPVLCHRDTNILARTIKNRKAIYVDDGTAEQTRNAAEISKTTIQLQRLILSECQKYNPVNASFNQIFSCHCGLTYQGERASFLPWQEPRLMTDQERNVFWQILEIKHTNRQGRNVFIAETLSLLISVIVARHREHLS